MRQKLKSDFTGDFENSKPAGCYVSYVIMVGTAILRVDT